MGYNCSVAVNIAERLLHQHGQFTSPVKRQDNVLPAHIIVFLIHALRYFRDLLVRDMFVPIQLGHNNIAQVKKTDLCVVFRPLFGTDS